MHHGLRSAITAVIAGLIPCSAAPQTPAADLFK